MASKNHVSGLSTSSQTFSSALSSAVSEWLLILLIYLFGLFSYLATKFARYSKIQVPCLLCSRLDSTLGRERPGVYEDLICHAHKLEISSLAYCHSHQKLADIYDMCETCLLSLAAEKKSSSNVYRSLVGKLERNLVNGVNAHSTLPAAVDSDGLELKFKGDVIEVPLLKNDHMLDSPRTRYCSCCNELFRRKSHVQRLLQRKSTESDVLLGQLGNVCLHHRDKSNKKREKSIPSPSASQIGNRGFDRLSHIGYTELKITSDSESEVPFSDEDDGNAPVGNNHHKGVFSQSLRLEPAKNDKNVLLKALSENMMPEKLIHATPFLPKPSHLVTPEKFPVAQDCDDNKSSMLEVTVTRDLGELDWNEFGKKDHPSTPLNLTSQITRILDEAEASVPAHCTSAAQGNGSHPVSTKDNLEISNSKSGELGTGDAALVSSTTCVETPKGLISTRADLKQIRTTHRLGSFVVNHMDLNDPYRLAIGYRMSQPSPRDSSRYHEDLKFFFSQMYAGRGPEFLYNDVTSSPRVHGQPDDPKVCDASSTVSQQSLVKKLSTERNEPGSESLDGSIIDEIEGESLIDRLKRQIELDRKLMSILYKELEEERSASAIAANQAMAMITRLQEEKAAVQMEALQYQRMMEEQAEYDQEALQESSDLLTEKEKEIQDLEVEIEIYKKRLGEESFPTKMKGDSEEREDDLAHTQLAQRSKGTKILERKDTVFLDAEEGKELIPKDALLDFDEEKMYISECLKRLENKLHLFSQNGIYADISRDDMRNSCLLDNESDNGSFSGADVIEPSVPVQGHIHEVVWEDGQLGKDPSSKRNGSSFSREDSHHNSAFNVKESHNGSLSLPGNENKESYSVCRTTDLTAIQNEVFLLSERLEALEADTKFLEHSINLVKNGNNGVQFIQEIISHLQELRSVGNRKREQKDV